MKRKKRAIEDCATELAAIIDKHLARLSPEEQERRTAALERIVARVTGRAKRTVLHAPTHRGAFKSDATMCGRIGRCLRSNRPPTCKSCLRILRAKKKY